MQTYLDTWVPTRTKVSKRVVQEYREARPAKLVKLKPVGFPLKDFHRSYSINIEDEALFEIYAKEQWMGSIVCKGDYLFDQRVIPDFAFQIIKVLPQGDVKVGEDTLIKVEKGELKQFFSLKGQVRFKDIIGHEDVKRKCKIVERFLKDPKSFGNWAPKNVLFYGPPGTGKTMTSKALATETSSSLYLVRATDLVGEYVGDGSRRIHDLYKAASECAPSIVFIDELDAIGLDRAYQSVRGDVSEVVNALLTELDGLKENEGTVTIAATNNPKMLDHALRSRFEEEFEFKLPTPKERLKILKHYAKTLPIKVSANLNEYVKKTEGFSGRDLKEKFLKTALHKAILEDADKIEERYLSAAFKEIKSGKSAPPKEMFV
ncbi:MAG: AAA family ATPase [Candidatus Hydrothermarchaeales archaeon]